MLMCLFLRENVSFHLILFPKRSERIVRGWMGFGFSLEDTQVARMLTLTRAWTRGCHFKGAHLQVSVSIYVVCRLGQIQAAVPNALGKQRYTSAISIFSYCMDLRHAVPTRSPSLTAYSRSLASPCHLCLSAPTFAPSIVSSPNRWGLKPPLSALFLNNITLMQMRRRKMRRKQCLSTCTGKYL